MRGAESAAYKRLFARRGRVVCNEVGSLGCAISEAMPQRWWMPRSFDHLAVSGAERMMI